MTDSATMHLEGWLLQAKQGSQEALGSLLSAYINYLKTLAQAQMDERLKRRIGASDIVQDTLLEAHRDFLQFVGKSPAEFSSWLRMILTNNLRRAIESHLLTAKRDLRRELPLDDLKQRADRSAMRLESLLATSQRSVGFEIQKHESLIRLSDSIAKLPEEYREVIILRHIQGMPFKDIAIKLGKSSAAVRMVWIRAIDKLRQQCDSNPSYS